jgi:hypothetical protein
MQFGVLKGNFRFRFRFDIKNESWHNAFEIDGGGH